jgi:putative nucleotidyltransferase with HDIG domain
MAQLLLVDDDHTFIAALKRSLALRLPSWEIQVAHNGIEALGYLERARFDAVVSDLDMPIMSGEDMLAKMAVSHPEVGRIALSGNFRRCLALALQGRVHQVLEKPCAPEVLAETVVRVSAVRAELGSEQINNMLRKIRSLPSLPKLYYDLSELVEKDDYLQSDLIRLVEKDVTGAATILRVANSAYIGAKGPVSSLPYAITLLGTSTIKSIILSSQLFTQCSKRLSDEFSLGELWNHSSQVGYYARVLATKAELSREVVEFAFAAGLLHDIGKLILIQNLPEEMRKVRQRMTRENVAAEVAELEILGATHSQIGAHVLASWNLPEAVIESALYHHRPLDCKSSKLSIVGIVFAANLFDHLKSEHAVLNYEPYSQYFAQVKADTVREAWGEFFSSQS